MRRSLLAALLLLASVARADAPPACGPPQDGARACMAQQVCTCGFDPGGELSGQPPGWRWSCHIMQMCDTDAPADLGPPPAINPGPLYVSPNITPPSSQPAPMQPFPMPAPWRRP